MINDCWEWKGARSSAGYGQKWTPSVGQVLYTHRLAYEWANGPIPSGMIVLHACDNPPCCNPSHLRLGTHADNVADKMQKGRHENQQKTHCKYGHPFHGDNLIITNRGYRRCRTCKNHNEKLRKRRVRAKA